MRPVPIAICLATAPLAACSQQNERAASHESGGAQQQITSIDISDSPPAAEYAAPNIPVTAAPGVAFNYRYAFLLPDKAIAPVQEQHASACEKLGPARCRITGMRYTLVDEDRVRGELHFKLDPTLARNFGKEGIAAVENADGKLIDAAITGTDVGGAISESQRRSQQLSAELARIERRLAGGGLSDAERTELRNQADRLRQQQSREQATRSQGEEMLANTPMTFTYAGDDGFALGGDALGDAWSSSQASFTTMVTIILLLLGTLLPWAVLVGLLVLLWRSTPLRRLRLRKIKHATEDAAGTAPTVGG